MKLLRTRSVDYFEQQGHDFWRETLLLSFSNAFFGGCEHHIRAQLRPIILERRQKSLWLINCPFNNLDDLNQKCQIRNGDMNPFWDCQIWKVLTEMSIGAQDQKTPTFGTALCNT